MRDSPRVGRSSYLFFIFIFIENEYVHICHAMRIVYLSKWLTIHWPMVYEFFRPRRTIGVDLRCRTISV